LTPELASCKLEVEGEMTTPLTAPPPETSAIRTYSAAICAVAEGTAMARYHRLLLDHGTEGRGAPKPRGVKYGKKRECFRNALHLAMARPDLTYVEGIACWHIPTAHAWCVDAKGRVIDPTWRVPKADVPLVEYLGLRIKTEWAWAAVLKAERYGVITTGRVLTDPMEEWAA
jgi:hypothetical protein